MRTRLLGKAMKFGELLEKDHCCKSSLIYSWFLSFRLFISKPSYLRPFYLSQMAKKEKHINNNTNPDCSLARLHSKLCMLKSRDDH